VTLPTATTPGLTYWRCPECPRRFGVSRYFTSWDQSPRSTLVALEALVEAHEAEHMAVTG
jgi:hypothetical protein